MLRRKLLAGIALILTAAVAVIAIYVLTGERTSESIPLDSQGVSAANSPMPASNSIPNTNVGTAGPTVENPTALDALSDRDTTELLAAMRLAYDFKQLDKLDALRRKAIAGRPLNIRASQEYYKKLICDDIRRWDNTIALESAIIDAMLHHWPRSSNPDLTALRAVDQYVYDVIIENHFLEFRGRWRVAPQNSEDLVAQHRYYQRPKRCLDSEALLHLLDAARTRFLGKSKLDATPIQVAVLLKTTGDYVSDRLSFFQVGLCRQLVELQAMQHVPDLKSAAEMAKIADVRIAAYLAYCQLSGLDYVTELNTQWLALAEAGRIDEVGRAVQALLASDMKIVDTLVAIQLLLTQLNARGISWVPLFEPVWGGLQGRPITSLDAERDQLRDWLRSTFTDSVEPWEAAIWGNVVGFGFGRSDDAAMLANVRRAISEILRGDNANGAEADFALTSLFMASADIINERNDYWTTFDEALNAASKHNRALVHKKILEFGFQTIAAFPDWPTQSADKLALLNRLTVESFEYGISERTGLLSAWELFQHTNVRDFLIDNAEDASSAQLREFYSEALVRWQTVYDRRVRK